METMLADNTPMSEQNRKITDIVRREGNRLRRFIRQRVRDPGDAEDIVQEVFFELAEAYRLPEPIEQMAAWMRRVALNRITDLFRKKRPVLLGDLSPQGDDDDSWEEMLPSADDGPEAAYLRGVLLEELQAALDELPEDQRVVFIAHEIDGIAFKDLAERDGVSVNTLLSRKRYAVLHLRERLRAVYDDTLTQ